MRLAIIGQGPRGIQALFALAEVMRGRDESGVLAGRDALEVACFDSQPPGAGAAYALDQPDSLRLNVRPDIVDLPGCPTFVAWLRAEGLATSDVPRRHVGRYLQAMRDGLLADLPAGMSVIAHRARVMDLVRHEGDWLTTWVRTDAAAGSSTERHEQQGRFDEVLLAIGHAPASMPLSTCLDQAATEGSASAHVPASSVHPASLQPPSLPRVIDTVYPTGEHLDLDAVPPGSRVIVRGAALTFIDVALVLGADRLPHERPAAIIPTSRSGLLMSPKPLPRCADDVEGRLLRDARRTLRPGPAGVLDAPRTLALALLSTVARDTGWHPAPTAWRSRLDRIIDGESGIELDTERENEPRLTERDRLAQGIELARRSDERGGLMGPDASSRASAIIRYQPSQIDLEWALGRAWALLYPDIVTACSWYDDHAPDDPHQDETPSGDETTHESATPHDEWVEFRRQAARYERLTFGPTLPQAQRLLALCDTGFIDTSWLDERRTLDDENPSRWSEFADVVIDAVLAPPGVAGNDRPLISALEATGSVTRAGDGRRGLLVTESAQCIAADGLPTPGLSCVGRVSEDIIVGHDTLNRHAHPHLARWAERIGEQL